MIRGLYTAASGLILGLRRQEVVADNLANINSPGYKGESSAAAAFSTVLARSVGNEEIPVPLASNRVLGVLGSGAYQDAREVDMAEGTQDETGRALDIAISGPGFFAVQADDGMHYTRDGHFTLDDANRLVTADGQPVLSAGGGPIEVDGEELVVRANGDVIVDGGLIATLQVVQLDPARIIRAEGSQFAIAVGGAPAATPPGDTTQLRQGALEGANIDLARTSTAMVANQRSYGASQTVFATIDDTLGLAVESVGRVA